MRRLLIVMHTYAGLVTGLLLSLIGITGSLLVFDHALDEILTPETLPKVVSDQSAPLEMVLTNARAALDSDAEPYRIHIARQPGSPHVVRFPAPDESAGPIEVSVAPATAEVLAVRSWGEYPMSWLYTLHYTLLAGTTGKYVVGVAGLFLLFFCFSGLYLWWPRNGRWRRALTIERKSGVFRFYFDLHKTAGFYLLPVLAVAAFSGISLVFHDPVESLVGAVSTVEQRPAPTSVVTPGALTISVDEAVTRAQAVFPAAELKRVFLPNGPEGSYKLALNLPGEPWTAHAASLIWVDQYSGDILATWNATDLAAGTTFLTWQFPLHNGDALGLPGRWLVFFTGWMPVLLFATGFYTWLRKRRLRRKSRSGARYTSGSEPAR